MFHNHLPPDGRLEVYSRMESYDADQDRERRRRRAQDMLWQFAVLCVLCVIALALLFLASLIL
jgi:hypothetical protein